jgi:hypothetical protein
MNILVPNNDQGTHCNAGERKTKNNQLMPVEAGSFRLWLCGGLQSENA